MEMINQQQVADAADESDEEFRLMDERIQAQVVIEKRKQQLVQGEKLSSICIQIGRCPICTLKPPCKHRQMVDQSIHPDLIQMTPKDP